MNHKLLAGTVATALLAVPTPGRAAVDTNFGTNPVLDAQCDAALSTNDNSDFTTYAIIIGSPSISSTTVDNGPTTYVGVGPSTLTIGNYHGAHVNGKSVNIHAYGDIVTTYAQGANGTTPTKTTTITTINASCHVHKPTNGNSPTDILHHDYLDPVTQTVQNYEAPPGLQGLTASTTETVITYGTRSSHLDGPWVDLNASTYGGEFVICISPSSTTVKGNPGVWRGQNGYTNQIDGKTCSTAWHDSLGLSVSVSVPAI